MPARHAPDLSHLVALFDAAHEAMLLTSASGTVLAVNERASRLFGRAPDELGGCQLLDLTDQHDPRVRAACIARHRSGQFAGEMRMCRADGTTFEAVVESTVFRDAGDRRLSYVRIRPGMDRRASALAVHQLHPTTAARAQLQHAQKLQSLGVLSGVIAHDFNNLLVGILGNASLALADVPPDSELFELLSDVETAALRAADLTRQLLAYSGHGDVVVGPVDMSGVVTEMAQLLRSVVSKQAELHVECAEGIPAVEGDATQLRQVVMNLITNASDALEGGHGTITLRTGTTWVEHEAPGSTWTDGSLPAGRYVYVEVTDSGSGMTADTQRRIFDPHFSTRRTGRGLGLATTLGIVRGHRGSVALDSVPGHGTTFRILLPVATSSPREHDAAANAVPARATSRTLADAPTHPGSGARVAAHPVRTFPSRPAGGVALVVDDDATVRAVARQMLERRGFRVCTAANGEEGLAVLARERGAIGLAFIDCTMPRASGASLVATIRSAHPQLRVVLMSGLDERELWRGVEPGSAIGVLRKPFRAADLLRAVGLVEEGVEARDEDRDTGVL